MVDFEPKLPFLCKDLEELTSCALAKILLNSGRGDYLPVLFFAKGEVIKSKTKDCHVCPNYCLERLSKCRIQHSSNKSDLSDSPTSIPSKIYIREKRGPSKI